MQAEHAYAGTKSASGRSHGTPSRTSSARLGGARADFVAGLGRKVADLRTTIARVKAMSDDVTPRNELRRKLHALSSAAKMMKFDAMDRGLAEAIGVLDRTAGDATLESIDLEAIEQLVEDLPALAWGDSHAQSARAQEATLSDAPHYRALIVGAALIAEALLDAPNDERSTAMFSCESTPDPHAACDLVRTTEPDLVVVDADIDGATDLVETLMDDPLTEAIPIVVVGSFLEQGESARYVAMGVAKTVSKPTSREALRAVCEDTVSPDRGAVTAHAVLGEPTLEELGDRLANELREAIVGRADPSARTRRIPLGQGTEVLGAVWGAIARVREVVTARSDGTVRFVGGPEGALTPAFFFHEPDVARADRAQTQRRGNAPEVRLQGRRIVIADDDPGVVWFLTDLLKTAGCIVQEAFDGRTALELAYEHCPDLVISDILMPGVDGFSLCRALRRDVALRDTPVILLSWKEDLLQRVRELGAGAAGYVRKESDTRAILARVREALRVRGRIETRLREDGEVRGRLDGVSVRTLLEIVCATRPEARVSVRDATFLYDVEIRWGAPQRVSRTDGEGGFVKGPNMLAQLLGVSAGRFTVTNSTTPIEAELDGNLAAQLAKPIAKARAATSLLTGVATHSVTRIRFDESTLADYLKATPERARLVVRRLANGAPPRELLLCGGCEPALLDDLLVDLASRGLVVAIEGPDGTDMLASTAADLLRHADARASLAPSTSALSPVPALAAPETPETTGPDACASDESSPLCTSPSPGAASSLGEVVLREVMHPSPQPETAIAMIDTSSRRDDDGASRSAPAELDEIDVPISVGTPAVAPLTAHGEVTLVDGTLYGEKREDGDSDDTSDASASDGDASTNDSDDLHLERRDDFTPFAAVTSADADSAEAPARARRKRWPMIAFVAATGVVAWAVLHFSTNPTSLPKQQHTRVEAPTLEDSLPAPATTDAPSIRQKAKPSAKSKDARDSLERSSEPNDGRNATPPSKRDNDATPPATKDAKRANESNQGTKSDATRTRDTTRTSSPESRDGGNRAPRPASTERNDTRSGPRGAKSLPRHEDSLSNAASTASGSGTKTGSHRPTTATTSQEMRARDLSVDERDCTIDARSNRSLFSND